MDKKHIVHLSTAHPASDNRIFRKEVTALHEAGIDVTLVIPGPGDRNVGPPRHFLPRRTGRLSRMVLGPVDAWRALRELRPSILHVHDPELIPLAVIWSMPRSRRAIYDAHEDLPKQVQGKPYLPKWSRRPVAILARALERIANRYLDAIVAATPSIAAQYTNPKTILVQNFPWLRDYPEPQTTAAQSGLVASYVGGISHERGWRVMVDGVNKSDPPFLLTLAGAMTAPVRREFERDDHPRIEHVGILNPPDVPAVIARSRVGMVVLEALPNHVASQPTKLYEYMATGRPFIASAFPAWLHEFQPLDCGLFVDPDSAEDVAAALDTYSRDPLLAERHGKNGRTAFVERYTFERQASALVELTNSLLDEI